MHRFFPTVLAEEAAQQGGGLDMIVMIGMIFLIFWFLVIRPGSKERKEREKSVKALKKHDKVVTNAGIHGTVMILEDENVVLRVDDKNNIRMKFSRAAIWQVLGDEAKGKGKGKSSSKDGDDGKAAPKGSKAKAYQSKSSQAESSQAKSSQAKSGDDDAPAGTDPAAETSAS